MPIMNGDGGRSGIELHERDKGKVIEYRIYNKPGKRVGYIHYIDEEHVRIFPSTRASFFSKIITPAILKIDIVGVKLLEEIDG